MMADTNNITMNSQPDQTWLLENLFTDKNKQVVLEKGDVVLTQDVHNQRLFYVASGQLSGYYEDSDGESIRLFTVKPKMLAGIYSFFYPEGKSYATVKADQQSLIYYFEKSELAPEGTDEYNQFLKHMLPAIVNEIYFRQIRLMQSTHEKHVALKQLYKAEKMATLGQLAAGLAHELNNAIGVLENKTNWFREKIYGYFASKLEPVVFKYFEKGLLKGQELSTKDVRSSKRAIQNSIDLDNLTAKKLARINVDQDDLAHFKDPQNHEQIEQVSGFWEVGLALHDMSIAADHTSHVIKSIREIGTQDKKLPEQFDIKDSITKALALIKSVTKTIDIKLELKDPMPIFENEGKFIQVWLNLIKNAAEVLRQNNISAPEIKISSKRKLGQYIITVRDNGPGIPPDIITNIFQPEMTTKVSGISFGMGLGLTIVERIIVEAGGYISVSSKPGKTAFKVVIPESSSARTN